MADDDVFTSPIVEEQFILRLPVGLAKQVKKLLRNKSNLPLQFRMDTDRKGKFMLGETEYDMVLANLQCILESHKTLDKRNFYKISDIGQIFIVKEDNDEKDEDANAAILDENTYELDSGITPPTRHIKHSKWRKKPIYSRADVSGVEEELHKITKGQDPGEVLEYVSPEEILRQQRPQQELKSTKLDQSSSSVTSVGLKVKVNLKRSNPTIPKPPKDEDDTLSSDD